MQTNSSLLVGMQVITAATLVLSTRSLLDHAFSMVFVLMGVVLGIWAIATVGVRRVAVMPELKAGAELVMTGPYRWIQHPMYSALLLATGGIVFSPFAAWRVAVWWLLFAVLLAKSGIEEQHLRQRFPAYGDYSRRTRRLIPFVV